MTAYWTDIWFYWLVFVLVSWFVLEVGSILWAKVKHNTNIMDWTLSETIRRWSGRFKWLAPVVCGTTVFLLVHFFVESNP
jgi:hypothetical protein